MKSPSLLDHLHYIAKRTFKGHALYLLLSGTDSAHKTAIESALNAYEQAGSCVTFTLQNGDKVSFFNNNKVHHLMLLALKIKGLLGQSVSATVMTSYDLKTQYSLLYNRVYNQLLTPENTSLHHLSVMQKIPHKPFTYEELQQALTHLSATSLTHLIRKQPVYQLTPNGMQVLFTSWFVKNADIRRALIPSVDTTDNPFFAAALQDAVEQKVFQKIKSQDGWIGAFNLCVQFLASPVIKDWCASHTPTQKKQILFDLSLCDVLENWNTFIPLKETLCAQGYRFIVRLFPPPSNLTFLHLPTDFIKIPATTDFHAYALPENILADVIVTQVDSSEQAYSLGQSGLINTQGFMDFTLEK